MSSEPVTARVLAGTVVTMDPSRPRAEAVALSDATIVAVGDRADVAAAMPGVRVEEVPGTIVPGLIDSHMHLQWMGLKLLRLFGHAGPPDPDAALAALDADGAAPVWCGSPTLDDRLAGLGLAQRVLHALGVIGVVDPAVTREEMAAYQEARRRDELTIRVVAMPLVSLADGAEAAMERLRGAGVSTGFGDDVLRIGPAKVYYDGQGRAGTALLRAPWPRREAEGYRGDRLVEPGEFARFAAACAREGWSLGVHVVGGAGIDEVLGAFACADAEAPIGGRGFTLIHAYLEPGASAMTMAQRLDVAVASQPAIQWVNGAGLVERAGAPAAERANPLRSWRAAGVTCGGGSDGPYFPADPRLGLWQARTRAVAGLDEPLGPAEALDAASALELYTVGAAAVSGAGHHRGRLAPGMLADLVALSVDPLTCGPDDLLTARALRTVVGGRPMPSDARCAGAQASVGASSDASPSAASRRATTESGSGSGS